MNPAESSPFQANKLDIEKVKEAARRSQAIAVKKAQELKPMPKEEADPHPEAHAKPNPESSGDRGDRGGQNPGPGPVKIPRPAVGASVHNINIKRPEDRPPKTPERDL
jgi:hypothetical protein